MSPPSRVPALVLALAVLAPGCKVAGAKAYNLRVLHDDQGRHVRVARTMSDFRYALNEGLVGTPLSVGGTGATSNEIENPLEECVDLLNALVGMSSDDARIAALQVHTFAWLAVEDPWQISRTISVRELGHLGQRLGVEARRPDAPTAGVEDVRSALARLLRAVRIELGQEQGTSESDLAEACAHIQSLQLDRQGALRLLRAAAVIEKRTGRRDARWEPLRATITELERVCVREALLLALRDAPPREAGGSHPGWNHPGVRAAAVTACVRTFGPGALGEMLLQLHQEADPQVLAAVLHEVQAYGLPEDLPGMDEPTLEGLRGRWTALIVQQATQNPDGTVRVAAMRALETISGGEVQSLREEDWLVWIRDRTAGPDRPGDEADEPAPPAPTFEAPPPPPPAEEQTL